MFFILIFAPTFAQERCEPQKLIVKLTADAFERNAFSEDQAFRTALSILGSFEREAFFAEQYRTIPLHAYVTSEQQRKIQKLEYELTRIFVLKYSSNISPTEAAEKISRFAQIEYATPSYYVYPIGEQGGKYIPNDSLYAQQAFLKTMKAEQAWDVSKGDSTIVVAISDTGIDWAHPDLEPVIFINPGEDGMDGQGRSKRTNGVDDDGNNKIDDWHGWDYVAGPNGNQVDNDTRGGGGHGTMVCGLIGAKSDNRIGIASIGYRIKILPLKIGRDDGAGGLAIGSDLFLYPLSKGARAFNASWGGFEFNQAFQDLINYVTAQGMLIVGGAGNHGGTAPFYPSAYEGVLGVGVCNASDVISGASGYGPPVDIMTPADGSLSTSAGGGYAGWGGLTSAAAPIATGLAGLVASHFKNYTSDQVRERIRVTCDNIDAQNPTKAKFAARGRVNAYRALSDPPTPSIRLDSIAVFDPNGNRALEQGEQIGITVWLKNYLAPTGQPITVTLVPISNAANITLNQASATINALLTNEIGDNDASKMTFTVNASTNYDAPVMFRLDIKSGTYEDWDFYSVIVNASYKTIKSNNFSMSLPADGSLGYRDYPKNAEGVGVRLGNNSLWLGMAGLMIGSNAQHVVDAVRAGGANDFLVRDTDFRMLQPTSLTTPGVKAASEALASFDDASAARSRKLNVNVKMESFDFSNKDLKDMIFTRYTVRNDSTGAIDNLRIGLFMDWGGERYYFGKITFDSARHAGYVFRSGLGNVIVGTFVIDSLARSDVRRPTFWAMDNDPAVAGNPFGTYDGFTLTEKWTTMSSFTGRVSAGNPTAGNVGYVISSRAFNLNPGESAEVVFGHFVGASYNAAMTQQIDKAINFWRGKSTVGIQPPASSPSEFALTQVYPNPYTLASGEEVAIRVSLPHDAFVRVTLHNALGQEIYVIRDEELSVGEHDVTFMPHQLSSGIYLVRVLASINGKLTVREKSLIVR